MYKWGRWLSNKLLCWYSFLNSISSLRWLIWRFLSWTETPEFKLVFRFGQLIVDSLKTLWFLKNLDFYLLTINLFNKLWYFYCQFYNFPYLVISCSNPKRSGSSGFLMSWSIRFLYWKLNLDNIWVSYKGF